VAGCDPGTSSLDLLILEDGAVGDQCRFLPEQLGADPSLPVRWLEARGPFDLIAGPSGYGLPLRQASECTADDLALMTLVRADDQGRQGVTGFRKVLSALIASRLPVVFLPGVIHLPTVPAHRKLNRIDLGTPDKLCVAALALDQLATSSGGNYQSCQCCLVELGSAFTACVVIDQGKIVDGLGGTSGPLGWGSSGSWDGEVAYLFSPLAKRDLFTGGAGTLTDSATGQTAFREALLKAVAGLQAATPFRQIVLSGRLLEMEPGLTEAVAADLARFGTVRLLGPLPGAWVKHAAQGAALLADGLSGGRYKQLVESLRLRQASGSALDWLHHPRAADPRGGAQGKGGIA
jgi:predicted butyrate kinase (DUF1464 family)